MAYVCNGLLVFPIHITINNSSANYSENNDISERAVELNTWAVGKRHFTLGAAWLFHYDQHFRVTRIDYPENITTHTTYDSNHNRASETDKNGNTTYYTYDFYEVIRLGVVPANWNGQGTFTQYNVHRMNSSEVLWHGYQDEVEEYLLD